MAVTLNNFTNATGKNFSWVSDDRIADKLPTHITPDENGNYAGVNDKGFELDTGIFYYFDGTEWQVIPSGSGGGGTPTVMMDGGWGIASATATVGETSVSKAIPMGGVWCALTEESGTYYYKPFGDTLPPALGNSILAIGFSIATDSSVDDNTRLYIIGSTLLIPANETLGTPDATIAFRGFDGDGNTVYAAYYEDRSPTVYAEAKFASLRDGSGHEIGLQFISAAFGTAPNTTNDITAYFPTLGAKMLFFCQGVEVVE